MPEAFDTKENIIKKLYEEIENLELEIKTLTHDLSLEINYLDMISNKSLSDLKDLTEKYQKLKFEYDALEQLLINKKIKIIR